MLELRPVPWDPPKCNRQGGRQPRAISSRLDAGMTRLEASFLGEGVGEE
ncbi:hypothetical protein CGRA01v4_04659 [Colletotrichum graminicola]|nr:hypothetical protein CGRA01v4_04659 [Colletotrichum graminicola]